MNIRWKVALALLAPAAGVLPLDMATAGAAERIAAFSPDRLALKEEAFGVGQRIARFTPLSDPGNPVAGDAVDIFSTHDAGDFSYHLGASFVEEEKRLLAGYSRGAVAASLFAGQAEDFSRLDPGGSGMDPYFFHGGSAPELDYRGAAIDVAIAKSVNLQFALSDISAAGFDTRRTTYAGFAGKRAGAGVFTVARDSEVAATGVAWRYSGDVIDAQFRQVDHESGARYRSFSLSGSGGANRWFSFSIESGRNPLFRENDETRLMFRFGGEIGTKAITFNAEQAVEPGTGETTEETTSNRGRNLALLAGAVVAIGAASSSGSETQDATIRIAGQNNAARTILNRINPVSVRQNREHGGWIYRNRDGTYGYTEPVAGTVASVDIGPTSSVPRGTLATASYHTHGGPDPRYDNENFSPADILSDNLQGVDGYLGTPAGQFLLHDYQTQRIIKLGTIAN